MRKFIFLTVSILVVAGGCWNNSKKPPAEPNTTVTTLAKDELATLIRVGTNKQESWPKNWPHK